MPLLHITTRIEDRKHDDLLLELGFESFPAFGFVDPEGVVVARQYPPFTVGLFHETGNRIKHLIELARKAEAGDDSARVDALLLSCELGGTDYADLEERLEGLELNESQKAKLERLYADDDLDALQQVWRKSRDPEFRKKVVEDLVTKCRDGEHPLRTDLKLWFWRQVAAAGSKRADPELLRLSIESLKPLEEHVATLKPHLRELEARLAALKSGSTK